MRKYMYYRPELTYWRRRDRFLIETRNDKVCKNLRRNYDGEACASPLNVFCVSNKIYWDHRDKSVSAAMPDLLLSGIIELRKHLLGIVANSRLRDATHYMQDSIPGHVSKILLWVESGAGSSTAEQKAETRSLLRSVDKIIKTV